VEGAITVLQPVAPSAAINAAPRSGVAPLEVFFADASDPGTAEIQERYWDFGDGGSATTKSVRHTYTAAGTYDVSLWVKSNHGEDTAVEHGLIVVEAPTPPTASFESEASEGVVPLTVQFIDQSIPGASEITSWYWDFGDGQRSNEKEPKHLYETSGDYTVSLTVRGAGGTHVSECVRTAYVRALDDMRFSEALPDARVKVSDSTRLVDGRLIVCGRADYDDEDAGATSRPLLVALDGEGNVTELDMEPPETGGELSVETLLSTRDGGFWAGGWWDGPADKSVAAATFIKFRADLTLEAFHWGTDHPDHLAADRRTDFSLSLDETGEGRLAALCGSLLDGGEWPPVPFETAQGLGPIVELRDGGLVCRLPGEGLSKRDDQGNVLWAFSDVPGERFEDIRDIVPCRDGGFLLLYKDVCRLDPNTDPHQLAKYDADGELRWHRTLYQPTAPGNWREVGVHELPKGHVLLVAWGTIPDGDADRYRGILTLPVDPERGEGALRPDDIVTE